MLIQYAGGYRNCTKMVQEANKEENEKFKAESKDPSLHDGVGHFISLRHEHKVSQSETISPDKWITFFLNVL